jgi:hypothetical protein
MSHLVQDHKLVIANDAHIFASPLLTAEPQHRKRHSGNCGDRERSGLVQEGDPRNW